MFWEEKYQEVQGSTGKYEEVQRSTEKYREVRRSTEKYREVPRSTKKYKKYRSPLVPPCESLYLNHSSPFYT